MRLRTEASERSLDLDLRQPHQLEQSRFLHRLRILGVDWGRPQPLPRGKLGTFHELWTLRWRPECVLQIVEAGAFGNTLVDAATSRAIDRAESTADLGQTSGLVELVLFADRDLCAPDPGWWPAAIVRDIPHGGERINRGAPVCTLISATEGPAEIAARGARLLAALPEAVLARG